MSHILVVDDEQAISWALQRALTSEGHHVVTCPSAEAAFAAVRKQKPHVIILDVRLPGLDGLSALTQLRTATDDAPVIIITAFGNLDTAVRAVAGGAFDYLAKPFDLDAALATVNRALQRQAATAPPLDPDATFTPDAIVGAGPAMQAIFKRIALVAPRDACVLITGESGTGKELVARAVHRYSPRKEQPFLPVHIAALNPNLIESELFGHVKGAFTGASQNRPGLLTLADGGTVFLDELAEIPLAAQVKLLRVLERSEVYAVGANQPQPINARIVAATHQNLERLVAEGRFRHDLYFRLNVFQIHLPPLRQRREDIAPLAEHFLRGLDPQAPALPAATVQHLQHLPWRGNVRELRNALEHALIVARGAPLLPEHFPSAPELQADHATNQLEAAVLAWLDERLKAHGGAPPSNLHEELLHAVETPLLRDMMRRLDGNRWAAAQWLGLNRATVRKKLAQLGLADVGRDEEDA